MFRQQLVIGFARYGFQRVVRAVGGAADQQGVIRPRHPQAIAADFRRVFSRDGDAGGGVPAGGGAEQAAGGGFAFRLFVVQAESNGLGKGTVGGKADRGHVRRPGNEGPAGIPAAVHRKCHESLARAHVDPPAVMPEQGGRNETELQPPKRMGAAAPGAVALLPQGAADVVAVGGGVIPPVQGCPLGAEGLRYVGDGRVLAVLPQVKAVEQHGLLPDGPGDQRPGEAVAQGQGFPPALLVPRGGLFHCNDVTAHELRSFVFYF